MRKNTKISAGNLLLFIIWPFMAFISALRNYQKKGNKTIVLLFLALFGFTLVLGNEAMDASRYAKNFAYISTLSYASFNNLLYQIYTTESLLDVFEPIISFIISRFTDDHRFLFLIYALVFGFFYLKSSTIVYEKYIEYKNPNAYFFLFIFIIILNPIFNINGFRFYTAAWIFFYGAYQVVANKQLKFILLCSASFLLHASFLFAIVILLIYIILGNKNYIYLPLLIISIFYSEIGLQIAPQIGNYLGIGFEEKIIRYTSDVSLQTIKEKEATSMELGRWYLVLPGKIFYYYMVTILFIVWYRLKKLPKTVILSNIYSFILLFLAFTNFSSSIPSMGRFRIIPYMFICIYIIHYFINGRIKKFNLLTTIGIVPFLLMLMMTLRTGLDLLSPTLFGPTPFPYIINNVSFFEIFFGK